MTIPRYSLPGRPVSRLALPLLITFLAFALRLWQLDGVPPGWRDDELINSLVISQKLLDGDWAVYYPDASGHEALYHALNGVMLGLFGPTVAGIRWLSVILGTLSIPLTYVLGRRLVGRRVALVAAAALAVSFWSLMYSRFGLRHISLPVFSLAAFACFWIALERSGSGEGAKRRRARPWFAGAGVLMGLGFYTYFASRGVPLILLAFCGYLWLVDRPLLRRNGRGLALMFAIAALLSLPLAITLSRQPESEARVAELALPLVEARAGNFQPLWHYTSTTLQMFHSTGDDEWLYNIPDRPLFSPLGALFFWSGVLLHLSYILRSHVSRFTFHVSRSLEPPPASDPPAHHSAFLLLWWLAGIAPGFISVPPASLSHTILAQPAVYLLAASPLLLLDPRQTPPLFQWARPPAARRLLPLLGLLLVASVALRDLPAYFREWPVRGNTRFLYRADLADLAAYLDQHAELTDFAVSSLLAGPWDKIALEMELAALGTGPVDARWYHPERAIFLWPSLTFSGYPRVSAAYGDRLRPVSEEGVGGYRLAQVAQAAPAGAEVCFTNGLCWQTAVYHPDRQQLELGWRAGRPLTLPPMPLISNPPPPGVYAGPRLYVFAQLLDADGNFLAGDDGFWVDAATLQDGDRFLQQHHFALDAKMRPAWLRFGLYDPMNGARILTDDGEEYLQMEING